MTDARAFLKDNKFLKELKPCIDVLKFICQEATMNNLNNKERLTNTNIAKELYKEKYEELDKQFKIAVSEVDDRSSEYKQLKKDFARKKTYPIQTINRKCKTLCKLELIEKKSYQKKSSDKRNTFYYPTQLGIDICNILKIEGFPILPSSQGKRKKNDYGMLSEIDFKKNYRILKHNRDLKEVIDELIKEFPETMDFGIYITQNKTSKSQYNGELFNVEKEKHQLYKDFFSNHLKNIESIPEKIEEFKEKSKEFWEKKNELFEEIKENLENYFEQEILNYPDFDPVDDNLIRWIYEGASYLECNDSKYFKKKFSNINLKSKIIDRSIPNLYASRDFKFLTADITEFSLDSNPFIRTEVRHDQKLTKRLEKKLSEYMNTLQQNPHFEKLIRNITLYREISNLKDEIIDILEIYSLMPILPGDCEIINPNFVKSQ